MASVSTLAELAQALTDGSQSSFWQRRQAAKRLAQMATGADGQASSFSSAEAQVVVEGLAAGLEGIHWGAQLICRHALERLQNPALIEAVCDVLMNQDLPRLRTVAVHARYAPQDPRRRAAYLYTLARPEFSGHDPDGGLLKEYYQKAFPELRERLLGQAQSRGDQDWQHWLTSLACRQGWQVLSNAELSVAVDVLRRAQRWEELWALVLEGRVLWSWQGMRAIAEAGWYPQNGDAAACWRTLVTAVQAVPDPRAVVGLVGRQRAVLPGHYRGVWALALSPDGQLLASGGGDHVIRLWKLPRGQEQAVLRGHQGGVWALAVSPDGQLLASSDWAGVIRLWTLPEGQERAVLPGHQSWVRGLAVSADGQLLVGNSQHRSVRLWTVPGGQEQAVLLGHRSGVNALAISSAGQLLVSSSWDKTIRLWTLPGGQEKAVLRGNQNEVRALAVSPAGQLLVSGSNDGTIQLWKLSGGQEQAVLYGHRGGIEALAVSADAQTLATGGSDQNIILWELWEMVHMLQVPLAHMDRTDFERIQGWKNDASLSPGQHAVACYVAAVLHYRLGENAP